MRIEKVEPKHLFPVLELIKEGSGKLDTWGMGYKQHDAEHTFFIWRQHQIAYVLTDGEKVVGILAGLLAPYFLNYESVYFQEILFYIRPEYQGKGGGPKLYKAVEAECKKRGVKKMIMAHTYKGNPEGFRKFYKRLGYKAFEVQYIKGL